MRALSGAPPRSNPVREQFRADVIRGLGRTRKTISSRYFYDAAGDRLFQRIMASPDYYLTRAEDEILREQTDAVLEALANGHERFRLFELGAGDGAKTKHLLRRALEQGRDPLYRPIDISANVLRHLESALAEELPALRVEVEHSEYFEAARGSVADRSEPKAILFLGSNIGNLDREAAIALLRAFGADLAPSDRLLVGFDRKKDPSLIRRAYDDADGITREFNLNLLRRMNRELGADFDLDRFVHAPLFCPATGRALSYLVSTCDQTVRIEGADYPIRFRAWEAMLTEISQKYDDPMIEDLAGESGLQVLHTFTDRQGLFSDVVFGPAT